MFDFVLFFLVFLPAMDGIRNLRGFSQVQKLVITGVLTSLCGSYFVYTSILAGKYNILLVTLLFHTTEKPQNYYELLGIPARGVSKADLKKAFRAASIRYHPDKNPDKDTTDLFIEVKEANDVISDEQKRFAYDVYAQ